ncbi:MAG: restriction endonuclease, partial [Aggregatilineales bacterium]
QKLERQWIGIDITHLGINLLKGRLRDTFDLKPGDDYSVTGEPQHLEQAKELAENTKDGRHQFQLWAGSLVQARPFGGSGGKRGADGGIDGIILFDEASDTKKKKIIPREVIVSVKSGKNIGVSEIRDLIGTVNNSKDAVMGVYITLYPPTKPMINAALSAGMYESTLYEGRPYPKIQILTIEQLLAGADVTMPPRNVSRIQAQRYVASHDKRYNGKKLI